MLFSEKHKRRHHYHSANYSKVIISAIHHAAQKSGMPRNSGPEERSPGISGRDFSDTNYFIRGLHGEYLVSWGPFSSAFAINPPAGFQVL
jgi:hypothetical protein